jgi:hypothetical protein
MAKRMRTFTEIELLELELVNPKIRKDSARLNELIADDFEEFGSSGRVYKKEDVLHYLPQEEFVDYKLSNFSFKELGASCMLVKYQSIVGGKRAYRSSIWVKNSGQWQLVHHQATVVHNAI